MREEERSRADFRQLAETAAEIVDRAAAREDVATLLASECIFEVPFSHQVDVDGHPVVVRGVMDCLSREPDGDLTVVDFKTGAQTPEHQRQLDLYVEAARVVFPGHRVDGRLIYLS